MTAAFGDARLPLRFWSKVLPCDDGCWFWIAALSGNGYASFGVSTGRSVNAHRHAYLTLVGPVDPWLDLDHLCRNRDCVNPDHLEPVTRKVNAERGDGGRHQREKTHCAKGHPYDAVNTRWRTDRANSRDCRACKNDLMKAKRMTVKLFAEVDALFAKVTDADLAALDDSQRPLLESA